MEILFLVLGVVVVGVLLYHFKRQQRKEEDCMDCIDDNFLPYISGLDIKSKKVIKAKKRVKKPVR